MAKKKGLTIKKDDLEGMYLSELKSTREIGRLFNISSTTVFYYLRKYHIPTRNNADTFTFSGHTQSDYCKKRTSETHKGKHISDEAKRKISQANELKGIGHKKIRDDGYVAIYFPDHPRSSAEGYIMEHILMMECFVGRHLERDEVVHHINGVRNDNRKSNLQLMTRSEHAIHHANERRKTCSIA